MGFNSGFKGLSQLKYSVTSPFIEKPVHYWKESEENKRSSFATRKVRPRNARIHMSPLWAYIFSDATQIFRTF